MEILNTIEGVRQALEHARRESLSVGLVPTMGFLHHGHESLIDRAAAECEVVVTTAFVNPLQFAPEEDLESYPQDPEADASAAAEHGTTFLFRPGLMEMYPEKVLTSISVGDLSAQFEGFSRPTHFDGVATVVGKLFNIVGSCRAYFGEKDWQQLAVVSRLVRDLSFPVQVIGCPIVREPDGLAMSSRNVYLSGAERDAAPILNRALTFGSEMIASGEQDLTKVVASIEALLATEPLAQVDYVAVVDAKTMQPVERLHGELRLLTAVRFGRARLIDNVGVSAASDSKE